MAVNSLETTPDSEAVIDTPVEKMPVTYQQQQQQHFTFLRQDACSFTLRVSDDGSVQGEVSSLFSMNAGSCSTSVTSSVKDCNLNIYANAKCSSDDVFLNRATPCEISSNGDALRLGSRIFFNSKTDATTPLSDHIDIANLSLYIDQVERHGKFLFVTSRQKLLEIPDEEQTTGAKSVTDGSAKALSGAAKDKSGDTSDSDSEKSAAESSVESEALSAYESWSEASTEYSETEVLKDTRPQFAPVPGDKNEEGKNSNSDDEDSSSSSEASNESVDEDSDADSIEAPNMRYAHVMDDEEEDRTWDMIWGDPDDQYQPTYDGDEYRGAWDSSEHSEGSDEDGVRDNGGSGSDSESDSDKDEAKKQDSKEDAIDDSKEKGGVKSAVDTKESEGETKPVDKTEGLLKDEDSKQDAKKQANEKPKQEEESPPTMLGSSVSQLQVYDLSETPATRIFRFTRPTMQMIRNSPLAVHPTKPLVVWPLGDNNILFADFGNNTYYIRKFRVSRFWSQHVKIECHFSRDGKHLHVASLEMRRNLPTKKKSSKSTKKAKDDKTADKDDGAKAKEEEEKSRPECDLLILTYKLSSRKTTRAPPVLVHRTQLSLGKIWLAKALPTFTWTAEDVFVAHAVEEDLTLVRIPLSSNGSNTKGTAAVCIPRRRIQLETSDQRSEVYLLPSTVDGQKARLVITMKQLPMRKIDVSPRIETKDEIGVEKVNPKTLLPVQNGPSTSESQSESVVAECADTKDKDKNNSEIKPGSEKDHQTVDRHIRVVDIDLESEPDAWQVIDLSQLNKNVEEGMGQMEVEMVKFDRTDDCDCGND